MAASRACSSMGLSPRVRGKRVFPEGDRYWARSIPACAGEARNGLPGRRQRRVYPRVCGGSLSGKHMLPPDDGLSPRVRGKPF